MPCMELGDDSKLNILGNQSHFVWMEHGPTYIIKRGEFDQIESVEKIMNFGNPSMLLRLYSVDKGNFASIF